MRRLGVVLLAIAVTVVTIFGTGPTARASDEIVIGTQCDRTGATQVVGVVTPWGVGCGGARKVSRELSTVR